MGARVGTADGDSIALLACGNDACEVDEFETDETMTNECPDCGRWPEEILSTERGTPWRDDQ